MTHRLFLAAVVTLATTGAALACAPAPSCWIKTGPGYLRPICVNYAKQHMTLSKIADTLDEPDKIDDFAKACQKLHVDLPK